MTHYVRNLTDVNGKDQTVTFLKSLGLAWLKKIGTNMSPLKEFRDHLGQLLFSGCISCFNELNLDSIY